MAGPAAHASYPGQMSDTLELLGFIAYTELTTFTRLAGAAATAPTSDHQLRLVRLAGDAVNRMERILARIEELGGDADAQLLAFDGTFDDYNARTVPGTWWENLLKGYVGNGVADDFCRIAVDGLDEQTRSLVIEVLDDNRNAEMSVRLLADAAGGDGVLASRLALWGRRLVGEALGLMQSLIARHDGLNRLVLDGARQRAGETDVDQSWVFAQLTAEHTRRMGRLGLAA